LTRYAHAWDKDPIINGVIAMSGLSSITRPGMMSGEADDHSTFYKVSKSLGSEGSEAGDKALQCVRENPLAELNKAIKSAGAGFSPRADNITLHSDFAERVKSGKFVKVVSYSSCESETRHN
jgi:hypothetical protein